MLRTFVFAALACGLTVSGLRAQTWQPMNGPEGGTIVQVDASGALAAALTETGVWVSGDSGGSWRLTRPGGGLGPRVIGVHVLGGLVIAQDASLSVAASLDEGRSWHAMTMPTAGLVIRAAEGSAARMFVSLAETPSGLGTLFTSDDLGESWTMSSLPGRVAGPVVVRGNEVLAETAAEIFDGFGVKRSAFRSSDAGGAWTPLGHEWDDFGGLIGARMPALTRVGNVLVAGPSISRDGGVSWEPFDAAFSLRSARCPGGECEIIAPTMFFTRGAMYVHAAVNYFDDDGPEGWFLFRSTDLAVWQETPLGALPSAFVSRSTFAESDGGLLAGTPVGLFRSDSVGGAWARSETGLFASDVFAMATTNDAIVANVVNTSRVARFRPGAGAVWTEATIFPDLPPQSGLVLELFSPDGVRVFAGHQTRGITRSPDGGLTWGFSGTGLAEYNGTAGAQFREVEAFARQGTILFAGTGRGLEQRSDGGQGFVISGGGAFRSSDDGATWQSANVGLPVIGTNSFFEPQFDPVLSMASVGDALLAGQWSRGVARSSNAGLSWTPANTGLPMLSATVLNGAVNVLRSVGGEVLLGLDVLDQVTPPMFRSVDGGVTWAPAANGLPSADITSIAAVRGEIFASVEPGPWDSVFRSTDGGQSWAPAGDGLGGVRVRELAVLRGEVYAATAGVGVWRLGCLADFDRSGAATVQDLFAFLTAWFSQSVSADIDGSGDVGLQDLFDYLVAYFEGC